VDEVNPFETDVMASSAVVESLLKDMQKIFSLFVKFHINPEQIFVETNDVFRAFVKAFMEDFDALTQPQQLQPQQLQLQPNPHNSKIALELCVDTSPRIKKECGICLSEDIPCSKIAKLGCGHEFCCDCTEKFINAKPCCALCRADVKKVSVASKTALNKFKKNKKFSV
jgi:Tfp pilus assembly protein PilZ